MWFIMCWSGIISHRDCNFVEVFIVMEEKIRQLLLQYPNVIYGFTSISYSSYSSKYKSALVLAIPYGEQLTVQNYTEEKFEKGIQVAKRLIDEILLRLEEIFHELKVLYYIPPMAQNNEEELVAPFSYKYAAVNAVLVWIGKNDVVFTEKYGPRIRLSSVLIDHEFTYGQKIV